MGLNGKEIISRLGLNLILASLLVFPTACAKKDTGSASVRLDGVLRTASGDVPTTAHVAIEPLGGEEPIPVEVAADGTFTASIPANAPVIIKAAAPFHEETTPPAVLDPADGPARVEITLSQNPRPDEFKDVQIIGDFNKFSWQSAEPMTQQSDGTWTWTRDKVEGDHLSYQLLNVTTNQHSVNGTQNDGFEYDGGGDFRSLVHAENGAVTVVFDPSRLPPAVDGDFPRVAWDSSHTVLERCFDVQRIRRHMQADRMAAYQKHHDSADADKEFTFDTTPYEEQLKAIASGAQADLAASMARLGLMVIKTSSGHGKDPDLARKIAAETPPTSPAWGMVSNSAGAVLYLADDQGDAIAEGFHEHSPVRSVRLAGLSYEVASAKRAGNRERWTELYTEFKDKAGDSPEWKWDLLSLDPDKKIQKGNPTPEFSVKLLDGSTFSNADLKGHTTLIDFWATWCGPCRGEMPYLHKAWKEFHSKGLQIVSLSFDRSVDDIAPFREKWPMPWKHGFVEEGFQSDLAKSFEVMGIPEPVLIGPDGTILATEPNTRGEDLVKTLAEILGD